MSRKIRRLTDNPDMVQSRAGVATSTIMIGQNVGNALAPILGSYVVKASGYKEMFCGAGVVIAKAGLILVLIQYLTEKKKGLNQRIV